MGFVKVFKMDENGAGYVPLSTLSFADKVELELAIATPNSSAILCHVCKIEIPRGTGNSCISHKNARGSI